MEYIVHTDGAYSQLNNEGSFAYVICDKNDKELSRFSYKITNETNNRAELKAIIAAIHKLPDDATSVKVFSDSQYAINTLCGEWLRKTNTDLFDSWEKVLASRKHLIISWNWVKGHSGDYYNELCDKLCSDVLGYDPAQEYEKYKKKKTPTPDYSKDKEIYLKRMNECKNQGTEGGHIYADDILCELVEKYCPFGKDIVDVFEQLDKWYA